MVLFAEDEPPSRLVVSQVLPVNPAAAVRGPKHVVTKGATPVLSPAEARRFLEAIDTGTLAGRRDRALVSVMLYSFVRVSAEPVSLAEAHLDESVEVAVVSAGLDRSGPQPEARASEMFRFALPVRSLVAMRLVPPEMASSFSSATSSSGIRRPWTTISSVTTIRSGSCGLSEDGVERCRHERSRHKAAAQERLGVMCNSSLGAAGRPSRLAGRDLSTLDGDDCGGGQMIGIAPEYRVHRPDTLARQRRPGHVPDKA